MSTVGAFDAPIEIFSGLVTDMAPADLPHGVSPDCQDVVFGSGGVATRPGLQTLFGPLAGNPTVNYLKTYETRSATIRAMALDSNGMLYKEAAPGVLSSIASGLAPNAYADSTTLFGREYLAFSDGKSGIDLPRQYDDTNLDRVSRRQQLQRYISGERGAKQHAIFVRPRHFRACCFWRRNRRVLHGDNSDVFGSRVCNGAADHDLRHRRCGLQRHFCHRERS